MPRPLRFVAVLALVSFGLARPPAARATWSNSGNAVAATHASEDPGYPGLTTLGTSICPDMDGGAWVAWSVPFTGQNYDTLRINRLNGANGARMFGTIGIRVSEGGRSNGPAHVVSDGNRGAWVVWSDQRGTRSIYAQRYDFNGIPQFALGGIPIGTTTSLGLTDLDVAATASGKLLVGHWESGSGLELQRVALDGTLEFAAGGLVVTTDDPVSHINVIADGEGAFVVWQANRASLPGPNEILASRITSTGSRSWGTEGATVVSVAGVTVTEPRAAVSGSLLYVVWRHDSAVDPGIHAQRMLNGSQNWGTSGAQVMRFVDTPWDQWSATSIVPKPRVVPVVGGGCIVAWVDARDHDRLAPNGFIHNRDIWAQRMTQAGTPAWGTDGTPVDSTAGTQEELEMVSDEADGAILVYTDLALSFDDTDDDIHARRIDDNHVSQWSSFVSKSGTTANDEQSHAVVAPDGVGGVFIAWEDHRDDASNNGADVYATHRTQGGSTASPSFALTAPNGGEAFSQHEIVPITWTSSVGGNVRLEYQNGPAPRQLIVASTPDDGSFDWAIPGTAGSSVRVFVSDAADGSPQDSSNAAFSVCPTLSALGSYGPTTAANDVLAADFNEDGMLDLALSMSSGVQIALGQGAAGVGGGGFAAPVVYGNSSARDAATGDFNADGRLDLAVATAAGISVLFGNGAGTVGDGTFGAYVPVAVSATSTRGLVAADFNEDGIADLAWVNGTTNNVSRILGNGTGGVGNGTFGAIASVAVGTNPSRMVAADFNEDGILDLAATNNGTDNVSILLGQGAGGIGNGSFGAATNVNVDDGPLGIAVGDFNRDANLDLAVAGTNGVVEMLGFGDGTFFAILTPVPFNCRDVGVLDYDGDGNADLVTTASSGDGLAFLYPTLNNGSPNGAFTFAGLDIGGDFPNQLAIGDFLEDGVADVLVTNSNSNDYYPWVGGCGTTLPATIFVNAPNSQAVYWQIGTNQTISWTKGAAVLAVDVEISRDNGLNWTPIARNVTSNLFVWTVTGPTTNAAQVRVRDSNLQNRKGHGVAGFAIGDKPIFVRSPNGGESFRGFDLTAIRWGTNVGGNVKLEYSLNGGARQLIAASTPNDGAETWTVPNVGSDQVRVFVSDAADGDPEDASDAVFSVCKRIADPVAYGAGHGPSGLVQGDFNGDGITDLAAATSTVDVLLGQGAGGVGDGTFGASAGQGLLATRIAAGDFNGDGEQDLAGTSGTTIRLLLGAGDGSFTLSPVSLAVGTAPADVVVADFNEDGIDDLAATVPAGGRIHVRLGLGSGGIGNGDFGPPAQIAVGGSPQRLVVADFDEDGIWDLAVTNLGSDNVSVLKGLGAGGIGNGTFAAAVPYAVGDAPSAILATDMEDDGILDLAVLCGIELHVLPGNGAGGVGNGTFGSAQVSPLASGLGHDLAVVDFNFDEFPDLVVSADAPNRITLMGNDSGGGFGESNQLGLTAVPGGLLVGDFNEDGAHDVAVSQTASNDVRVFLGSLCGGTPGNVTITPPAGAPALATRAAEGAEPGGAAVAAATWAVGTNHAIQWTKSPNVFGVDLAVSRDGGASWRTIARNQIGTSFDWTVTAPQSAGVLLRASDASAPAIASSTPAPITITDPTVDAPGPSIPTAAAFSGARPNPSRGDVAFQMELPRASQVSVDVYDVSGRRIASLARGAFPAGTHRVTWNSKSGAPGTASGIFFVRARWEGFDEVRRVVRMP